MRVAFIAAEVVPFAKTGGLADVCGTLPLELASLGHEVLIIMPKYRTVGSKSDFNERAAVDTIGQDIRVFFIKSDTFFDREFLYGDSSADYADNLDRFLFFCREALELLKDLGNPVDIIHCHDWQTGLVPLFLRHQYASDRFFHGTRCVFTIHNLAYQGVFLVEEYDKLGVSKDLFNDSQIEFYGKINVLKTAIVFSDYVTTVSPHYAGEIQTRDWGFGLEGVLQAKKGRLRGILNGLDYSFWNPAADSYVQPSYSLDTSHLREIHKANLQKSFGLPVRADIPVFGFVGRLCAQKGLDLIESALEEILFRPLQLVFLGVGEDKYQNLLLQMASRNNQKVTVRITNDEAIAHCIYAGSDFFLMPSVYEPCGLAQMIALRYGTIPLVAAVGGLLDTVKDFCVNKENGNGVVMSSYSVDGFLEAMDRASGLFSQKERFAQLRHQAMLCRFSWESSAREYSDVYEACLK